MTKGMVAPMTFNERFAPADFIPFRDRDAIDRVNALTGEEFLHHDNPGVRIRIVSDAGLNTMMVSDMVGEIVRAKVEGRRCVLVLPNPNPAYREVARILNAVRMDLSHVTTFNMDEWADEDGNVAGLEYRQSFIASTKRFFWDELDPELRMPAEQFIHPTTENISRYSEMIEEAGGADVVYTGPGWTGHLAFVEPGAEFSADLDEFLTQGARIVTLHPLTIAQNSLHGSFGASGDVASVPPKAATIGPLDVVRAKRRVEMHGITTRGTFSSWQRTASRLAIHGPVTPLVPTSIMQLLGADFYVTEKIAAPVVCDFESQY